jgi:hypothetical protein
MQVLLLGQLAGAHSGDAWFSGEDIQDLFEDFRLPPPSNVTRSLSQLRNQQHVIQQRITGKWSLTPSGINRAAESFGEVRFEQIAAAVGNLPGADFARVHHTVLPPTLAPPRWIDAIGRLLEKFPFESNVFLMTRFADDASAGDVDPVADAIPVLRNVASHHGMTLHTAADRQIEDDIWGNVGGYIWACRYGIGMFETRTPKSNDLNDNVLIELGAMLTIGRRCMILKDESAPTPPTDLVAQIYKPVDLNDLSGVARLAHQWFAEDLGLGMCEEC